MDLAAVGSRVINNEVLIFGASGWTYFSTFVLYDFETESLWFPRALSTGLLTCVSGAFEDDTTAEYASSLITWKEWKALNPDTKFMKYVAP